MARRKNNRFRRRRRARRGVRKTGSAQKASLTFSSRSSAMTVRGNTILPAQLLTRLPYADLVQTSTTTTVPGIYTYRVNSMFDPDKSGAGFYPTGRDELRVLYQSYVCFGVAYDILCINMSDTVPARVAVMATSVDQAWSTFQEVASQPNCSKSIILGTLDGSNATGQLKGYISMAAIKGVPKKTVSTDDLYRALWTSSPDTVGFLQIIHGNLDGASTTDVHYEVHLKYFIRAFDLKPLTQTS